MQRKKEGGLDKLVVTTAILRIVHISLSVQAVSSLELHYLRCLHCVRICCHQLTSH